MASFRSQMRYMNPYDLHKALINEYILKRPGDASKILQRDSSKDRRDFDVLKDNHKFLWDDDAPETWEQQFAKKYYDKLFKEYCIGDLSLYKDNKIALRWRIEREVVAGKGQFICGNKKCNAEQDLKTWEVNFAYKEQGEKKNALVKIRLCPECSLKLNFHSKKREIKRLDRRRKCKRKRQRKDRVEPEKLNSTTKVASSSSEMDEEKHDKVADDNDTESPWSSHKPVQSKSRDEEMEEYLQDLLL